MCSAVAYSTLRASLLAGWFKYHLFELGQQSTARSSLWTLPEKLGFQVAGHERLQQKEALYLPDWCVGHCTLTPTVVKGEQTYEALPLCYLILSRIWTLHTVRGS